MSTSPQTTSTIVIRNIQGHPLTFAGRYAYSAAQATIDAVKHSLNYRLDVRDAGGSFNLIPDDRFNQKPLTVPERATVAAFAEYFHAHTVGMKRQSKASFPRIITPNESEPLQDVVFSDESRAYAFAEVAENVFSVTAEVVESQCGWLVTVSHPTGLTGEMLAELRGACRVLESYTVERAETAIGEFDLTPAPDVREAHQNRQKAPLARIEAALGEILARLDQSAAMGTETLSEAVDDDLAQSIATGRELIANIEDAACRKGGKHTSSSKSAKKRRSA